MDLSLMIEGQEDVTWPEWLDIAAACERSGIATLFRSDHYMNLDGQHPERGSLDAWGTLCGLAAATTRLRLGTMVSPATFRHPSELAKLVVTADHISGGRIDLGLGAGWHEREHAAYGFPFAELRTRMDVLEEQLQVIHGAWGDGPFSFDGRHYRLDQLDAQPKPAQQPHPPLIMGGTAGPRGARLAARYADEYNTTFPSLEEIRERRERVHAACAEVRREPLPFSIMTAVVAGSDSTELRDRAGRLAEKMGVEPDALISDPPSGWVIGTLDEVTEQLLAIREAGVARIMCQQFVHDDLEHIALLGQVLAPRVRD